MTARPRTGIREEIVRAAQEAFHERGYHGTTLDDILTRAASTKGSLYHHFSGKEGLTEAVIRERLLGFVEGFWGREHWHADPITYLLGWVQSGNPRALERGCPVNTLAMEVAYSHPELREALGSVFRRWNELLVAGLEGGKRHGTVRRDADVHAAATFYLACFEGLLSLAKVNREGPDFLVRASQPLVAYLEGLRA